MKNISLKLSVWVVALGLTAMADASTVTFSNQSTATDTYLVVDEHYTAFQFTATTTGTLTSIDLPLARYSGDFAFSPLVQLSENGAGDTVGTSLETWCCSSPTVPVYSGSGAFPSPVTFTSSLAPLLTAGSKYWLAVSWENPVWWQRAGEPLPGYDISNTFHVPHYETWAQPGAFTVNVQPVPLPAAAWLMISAVGALGATMRRKRAARTE